MLYTFIYVLTEDSIRLDNISVSHRWLIHYDGKIMYVTILLRTLTYVLTKDSIRLDNSISYCKCVIKVDHIL